MPVQASNPEGGATEAQMSKTTRDTNVWAKTKGDEEQSLFKPDARRHYSHLSLDR